MLADPKAQRDSQVICVFKHFWDLHKKKLLVKCWRNRPLGSISSTYLRTAFAPVAPKSVIIQISCQCLFTLLGFTGIKAVRRTLMKLSPGRSDLIKEAKCYDFMT